MLFLFQSRTCILIYLTVSLEEQTFLVLMMSNSSMISLINDASGVAPKGPSPCTRSSRFLSCYSQGEFTGLHFRATNHWVLLVPVGQICFQIYFSACDCQFQLLLWKRLSLFDCIVLLLCPRSVDYIYIGLFLGLLLHSTDLSILFNKALS